MPASKTLLIVYHSMTGGTRQMVEAAKAGAAAEEGVAVRVLHATQAGPTDVLAADGFSYERAAIEDWFAKGHRTSPKTGAV